jgi:uncharacterized membrane protein YdfJ with MMPL/SSD domain
MRLAAEEERIAADLERGCDGKLVPELESLIADHPLRERLRAQLMLALYRSGRQAEVLAVYRDARTALVDGLAIEPSAELQGLERAILRQDPALSPAAPEAAPLDGAKTSGRRTGAPPLLAEPRAPEASLATATNSPHRRNGTPRARGVDVPTCDAGAAAVAGAVPPCREIRSATNPLRTRLVPRHRCFDADNVFSALANLINRAPRRVLLVVLAITAIAAPLGIHVRDHLVPRGFDVAGSGSARARELIIRASGTDPANSVLALVHLNEPLGSAGARRTLGAVETRLGRDPAVKAVLDWRTAHNLAMVSRNRRSTYLIAALRPLSDKQQEEAGKRLLATFADYAPVTLGGNPVANHEISTTIENDLRRAELLGLPLIVLLSFFIFRGFVASLLAPLAGGITVLVSFFVLRELTSLTSLSIYALNLVTGLSIGLSIDWSLLLLSRYREERAKTADLQLALRRALIPAGHTILFSAITVAASLATLLVFPLRFLRSMGYGGIVASTVAMLVALVVLPTILRLLGERIDALTLPRWRDPRLLAEPSRQWRAVGRLTTEHALPVATIVIIVMLVVATPLLRIRWTTVDASSLPSSAQAYRADQEINRSSNFVPNGGTPFYLAFEAPATPAGAAAATALTERTRRLAGVRAVTGPRR